MRVKKILGFLGVLLVSGCVSDGGLTKSMMPLLTCEQNTGHLASVDGIVGGREVGLFDPDQQLVVELKIRRGVRDFVCTGSLLDDRIVLTAAHCVNEADASDIEVYFVTQNGCPIDRKQKVSITASKVVIHPEFDGSPKSFSDLALLRLSADAPKDQQRLRRVQPQDESTDEFKILGYGITDEKKTDSEILRVVTKPKSALSFKDKIVVIDQRNGTGFCRGDSGAPVLVSVWTEPKILAVNSSTVGMGKDDECHTLSVAMNLSVFGSWVDDQVKVLNHRSFFQRVGDFLGL